MSRVANFARIAIGIAIVVGFMLPLYQKHLARGGGADNFIYSVSPILTAAMAGILIGLIAFSIKWLLAEIGQARTKQKKVASDASHAETRQSETARNSSGSVMVWIFGAVAGSLIGMLVSKPVEAAMCNYFSQLYC